MGTDTDRKEIDVKCYLINQLVRELETNVITSSKENPKEKKKWPSGMSK